MADARNNSDDLDERIRRCVREELTISNAGVDRNSNQKLVTRMRDLIRSLVTFASRQLGGLSLSLRDLLLQLRVVINRILCVSQNESKMPPPRVTLKRRNKQFQTRCSCQIKYVVKIMKIMEKGPVTNMPLKKT